MTGTVLILGASGRFGRNAAEAFWNAGWKTRTFDRATGDLTREAMGADVIVNAWNPTYPDWALTVPELTDRIIDAAKASGATVLIPGNIYGYGKGSGPVFDETTPKAAKNLLGRIRNAMEDAYRRAGVRTIILRAGDYIDTEDSGNWFESHIAKRAEQGVMIAPGDPDAAHAWAYLPDVARAAVMLAEKRERLATFEEVLFPGFTLSLRDMQALASRALGRNIRLRRFPWWTIRLAAPFWPMGRHLVEMSYLWSMPHQLDGARFHALLPSFRGADPLTAISRSLGLQFDIHPDQSMPRRAFHHAAE